MARVEHREAGRNYSDLQGEKAVVAMTFYVEFYAEQAFLSFVKSNLRSKNLVLS